MKTQERTNDKNNDEEIEKIKWKKEEKNLKKKKKNCIEQNESRIIRSACAQCAQYNST